ncbi:unnamed protein product [Effrenium voratum]|nr:unnamed protein product [Effrenium voratum]
MLRKAMANKAPSLRVQAEKRSDAGGGNLPRDLPPKLKPYLPLRDWEKFRDTVNKALKQEKATRQRIRGTGGVPFLLGAVSVLGSCVSMVLLHILQLDTLFGDALLAIPPAIALCFWAFVRVLLMKHSRKHAHALQDVTGVLKKACHQLSQDHRMLAVTMHIGEEAISKLDWFQRAVAAAKDTFYIEFRILEGMGQEFLGDGGEKPEDSTRPPSGGSGSSLRVAALEDMLQLRPMSAPDVQLEGADSPSMGRTAWSGSSRTSKQAWT